MNLRWILLTLLIAVTAKGIEPGLPPDDFDPYQRRILAEETARRRAAELAREKNLPTLVQNTTDFESEDSELRRRAVLILGKYKADPMAMETLLKALKDPSPAVRQASLVALVAQPIERVAVPVMLTRMTDTEVSIRRICSAALVPMLSLYRSGSPTFVNGSLVYSRLKLPPELARSLSAFIADGHRDPDDIVRKNMVDAWLILGNLVGQETALRALKDKNRDIRITALDNGNMVLDPGTFSAAMKGMVDDDDDLVRLRLAKLLRSPRYPDTIGALTTLSKDSNWDVSNAGLLGLMEKGKTEAWETLKSRFSDGRMDTETATEGISLLNRLGSGGKKELVNLLTHNRTAFRAKAAETLSRMPSVSIEPELILKLINDSDAIVRGAASGFLQRKRNLIIDHIDTLVESPYSDVRILAANRSIYLGPQKANDILLGLFFDDNVDVRRTALSQIFNYRLPGWQQLLTDALDDDDRRIQERAVNLLSTIGSPIKPGSSQSVGHEILQQYLKSGKDEALKPFIRQNLMMPTNRFRGAPQPLRVRPRTP